MKLKELTNEVFHEIESELRDLKVKRYVDDIKSQGWEALVYECLECMYYRGKYVMPKTYEYRRELVKWYEEHIKIKIKNWRSKQ